MCAAFGIGQLHIKPKQIAGAPNTALDDIADTELTTDLLHVNGLALQRKSRVAGYYKAAGDPEEVGCQVVGDSIGDIFRPGSFEKLAKGNTIIESRGTRGGPAD